MIRLGIIGTAGRKPNELNSLTKNHMEWMKDNVRCYIEDILKTTTEQIILVSGGSAWVDHVAVQLFLEEDFGGLELYLPIEFDKQNIKFIYSHEGNILNFLHNQCQIKTGFPIFQELLTAMSDEQCKVIVKKSFLARNTLVANNNNNIIAFTFSNSNTPGDGGTYDTWKKTIHDNKIHISLAWFS